MNSTAFFFLMVFLCMQGTLLAEVPRLSDDELKGQAANQNAEQLAKVQGKWVRSMKTDNGTFKVVKEHKGNETTVTFLDADGKVVAAKKSQFRLEHTDKVRIFTFFNNVITAGPQAGQTDKNPQSYLYRIDNDRFVEVHGVLIGDEGQPVALSWRRMKE